MNVDNGRVDTEEKMKEKYGANNPLVVPVPSEEIRILRNWGRKKRERYAELLKEGASNDDAFYIVEHCKGVIPEECNGGIKLSDDFKMTLVNPVTGEEKEMKEGKDYTTNRRF